MNCKSCNTPLAPGVTVCPKCGYNNGSENTTDDFIELDDEPKVEITEHMAPPTLAVESENLSTGTGEINNTANVANYSQEEIDKQQQKEQAAKKEQASQVSINIPSVATPTPVATPTDGTAPTIQNTTSTAGNTASSPTVAPSKGKKGFKIAIHKGNKTMMIIVGVVFLIMGILLGKSLFSTNYCITSNNTSTTSKDVKYVSDGANNTTNIGNYTYQIPDQYTYDKSDGGVYIYDESDSFRIFIRTNTGTYADISGAKTSVRETLKENDITINNMKEITSNEVEFLVFEATTNTTNRLIAFADAGNDYVYYIEIVFANNEYNYDDLDIAADIIKNATYEERTSEMEDVEIYDIAKVAIQSAIEYKSAMANK